MSDQLLADILLTALAGIGFFGVLALIVALIGRAGRWMRRKDD